MPVQFVLKTFLSLNRRLLPILALSTLLLAIVGYATDQSTGLFGVSIISLVIFISAFHFFFENNSAFFDVVFANALTIYLCFFTFFVESLFADLDRVTLLIGFILPLASFLGASVVRRKEIQQIVDASDDYNEAEFIRAFYWLAPIIAIGVSAFVMHQNHAIDVQHLRFFFLGEMTLISLVVVFAGRDFALLLMDTGIVFKDFFSRNAGMIKPVFAFFTLYSMNIIVFAAIYRIIERMSDIHHFMISGDARDSSFVEALYFSMVTISTVGYGDILPVTNAIRFIVGIQTFMGTILFFFGVHAILAHKRADK